MNQVAKRTRLEKGVIHHLMRHFLVGPTRISEEPVAIARRMTRPPGVSPERAWNQLSVEKSRLHGCEELPAIQILEGADDVVRQATTADARAQPARAIAKADRRLATMRRELEVEARS